MVFNAVLFIAVLFITVLFLYLAYILKRDANKEASYKETYHIELSNDFSGQSLSIYLNDSLLMNGIIPDSIMVLEVNRFAEENALIVVDNVTDAVTPFNLSKEGGKVSVKKQEGELIIQEIPAQK